MVFMRWIGGKSRYVKILEKYLPETYNNYFEPFLGSGSFYFHLKATNRLNGKECYLSDINYDLISAYLCLQSRPRRAILMEILKQHQKNHSKSYFKQIRDSECKTLEELAAKFIYFNRACFSGIFRESRYGEYNVSARKSHEIAWLDPAVYVNSGALLQGAKIKAIQYHVLTEYVKPGDFIYADCPYWSFYEKGNRTVYGMFDFTFRHQKELVEFTDWCTSNGVYIMLSNSNSDPLWDLYEGYRIEMFDAVYTPNGASRVNETELIIMNYSADGSIIQR